MSSSGKTSLGLNLWSGGDYPQRIDFCNDNIIIDEQITSHTTDTPHHVSDDDRARWDKNIFSGIYAGNGDSSQTITAKCPFEPSALIVFAHNALPYVWKDSTTQGHIYTAFASTTAASYGVSVNFKSRSFTVMQKVTSFNDEVISLNESGILYGYIFIR